VTRKRSKLLSIIALSCALVPGAFAHHNGNLYFDGAKTLRLENATVVSLVLINPHSRLVFTIENEQGEREEWRAETQSHNALRRKGIRPDLVQPGDIVTVIGNPSRSGTMYLRMRQLILPNGDTVTFYGGGPAITPANAPASP
jgi:hypothetical protein